MIYLKIKYQFPDNYAMADIIMKIGKNVPNRITAQYVKAIKSLWTDPGTQKCYERSNEYQLLDSTK